MDIQERLTSTIHRIDKDYFLEEIFHTHSRQTDYWLGRYASEQRVWIGESDTLLLEQAIDRCQKMLERGTIVF